MYIKLCLPSRETVPLMLSATRSWCHVWKRSYTDIHMAGSGSPPPLRRAGTLWQHRTTQRTAQLIATTQAERAPPPPLTCYIHTTHLLVGVAWGGGCQVTKVDLTVLCTVRTITGINIGTQHSISTSNRTTERTS